jgi:hypothetical protein
MLWLVTLMKQLESVILGFFAFAIFLIPLLLSGLSLSQRVPIFLGVFGGLISFFAAYFSAKWE